MIERIISGGQTGADRAGWESAKAWRIPTGGWMPKGFKAEDGCHPEFAEMYGAKEMPTASYPDRTEANVRDSDMTLWFGDSMSRGGRATSLACARMLKHFAQTSRFTMPQMVLHFEMHEWKIINVAGNRESSSPGINALVNEYLDELFAILKRP